MGHNMLPLETEPDLIGVLFGHVLDAPLRPGGPTVLAVILGVSTLLLCLVFVLAFRSKRPVPGLATLALESLVGFLRDELVLPVWGPERAARWLPFLVSLFFFVLVANLVGLIPGLKSPTANLAVTSALALVVFGLMFGVGVRLLGLAGFVSNLAPKGIPLAIRLFAGFLEFAGLLIKGLILSLRLFANLLAGHLAILSCLALIFVLSPWVTFLAVPFALFLYLLEILVAFLQAFVFALLASLFLEGSSTAHDP